MLPPILALMASSTSSLRMSEEDHRLGFDDPQPSISVEPIRQSPLFSCECGSEIELGEELLVLTIASPKISFEVLRAVQFGPVIDEHETIRPLVIDEETANDIIVKDASSTHGLLNLGVWEPLDIEKTKRQHKQWGHCHKSDNTHDSSDEPW